MFEIKSHMKERQCIAGFLDSQQFVIASKADDL